MSLHRSRTSIQDRDAQAAEAFINALTAGVTLSLATRAAKVTERWVYDRFYRDDDFRAALTDVAAMHPGRDLIEAVKNAGTGSRPALAPLPHPSPAPAPDTAATLITQGITVRSRKVMMSRPHQRDAIAAVTSHLTPHRRAVLVAACGTGKTYIAARVAQKIAPLGRTLVLVPTLDLLAQTVETWLTVGHSGTTIAVCSAEEVLRHNPHGDVTTSPSELTALARNGSPVNVYATYASLPVLAAAHRDHALPRWDLAVIDEAHRTAGALGKAWAGIHHDEVIPARRRLYQTATPRIWAGDVSDSTPLATMDDTKIFGQVAYRLGFGEAIERGLLADYNVLVPVVTDTDLGRLLTGANRVTGATQTKNAALQTAILQAIRQADIRRVITYHHRVASARALADSFSDTARATTGTPLPPIWARAITGSHSLKTRDRLLRQFTEHEGIALIANARVFTEGLDIDGIDGIAFADPRGSSIDVVQAIGRALRQKPGAQKTASIIIPVYTGPDQDPELALESSAFAPLWLTLRALRAHDDRFTDRIELLTSQGRRAATKEEAPTTPWLRSLGEHAPGLPRLTLAIDLRVLSPKSAEWRRGYTAARRYHREHKHLDAPQSFVDPAQFALGKWLSWQRHLFRAGQLSKERAGALDALGMVWSPRTDQWQRGYAHAKGYALEHGHLAVPVAHEVDGFKLGAWIRNQRERPDQVTPHKRGLLDALDPDWSTDWPLAWRRAYHAACVYRSEHGSLKGMPRTFKTATGFLLGEWLHTQIRTREKLTPQQLHRLDELGIVWNQPSAHELAWRNGLAAARAYLAEYGNLQVPKNFTDRSGFKLGLWITNQRRRQDRLSPERTAALNVLGMIW